MKYYGNFSIIILLTGNLEQLGLDTFCLANGTFLIFFMKHIFLSVTFIAAIKIVDAGYLIVAF